MKRSLHIGVFREGRLVDERYVPEKRTAVTVGRAADNIIGLIGSKLPENYTLFTFDRHVPTLHVTPGMAGELALDGKTRLPLEALRAKGKPDPKAAGSWTIELPETVRGLLTLADTTFFIQVAARPAPPPASMLPRVARGGITSRLERTFTTVLVVAFAIESAGLIVIHRRPDLEADAPLSGEDLDRYAQIVQPKKEVPKNDDEAKKKAEEEKRKKEEEERRKKEEEARKKLTPDEMKAKHAEDVKKAVANAKLFQVLGAAGGDGALKNVFASGRGFSQDISDALNGAGGIKIANGDEGPEHKGAAGDGSAVGIGDLGSAAGGGGHGGLHEGRGIVPKISIDDSDVEVESTDVDKDALGRFIHGRLRSVQICYERELKLNPALKGKIVVRFTVTTHGTVGDCSIDSDSMHDDAVSSCIVRVIRSWFFPFKPPEDVPVSFPFVFQSGG